MKKIIIIILFTFIICACSYDKYEMPKDVYINTNEMEYKVYSKDGKLYDLIGDKNVEILSKNKTLDTSTVGENEIEISYKYKKRDYFVISFFFLIINVPSVPIRPINNVFMYVFMLSPVPGLDESFLVVFSTSIGG